MSVVALSPVAPEPASPMLTSVTPVTPNLDPSTSSSLAAITVPPLGLEPQSNDGSSSPGPGPSQGSLTEGPHMGQDNSRRYKASQSDDHNNSCVFSHVIHYFLRSKKVCGKDHEVIL